LEVALHCDTLPKQAHALQEHVQLGQEARIYVGMRYWHPFTEEAIARN
jgi:ferrochelatase